MPYGITLARRVVRQAANKAASVEGAIAANGGLTKLGNKTLQEHINTATRSALENSENPVLSRMHRRRGIWGSGTQKGQDAVTSMFGHYNRFVGESADINAGMRRTSERIEKMHADGWAEKTATKEQKKALAEATKEHKALRKELYGVGRTKDAAWGMAKGAWGYMNSGSLGQRAAKFGTVGAGVIGVGTAGRMVTGGGSATYNSNGERDIAGIPFI